MDLSVQTDLRVRLFKAGYSPLPLQGKIPPMEGWQQKTQTNTDEIKLWSNLYPYCANTGILTRLTPTIDIDIVDEAAAEAVEELARDRFEERGWFFVRIGKAPKRAVLMRTLTPFKKDQLKLIAPNGIMGKIEILADGQQVVVDGIHPETKLPYTWYGGEPWTIAADELPYISEAEAHAFLVEAGQLLAREFGYTLVEAAAKATGTNGHDHATSGDWSDHLNAILTGTDLHDATTALAGKLVVGGLGNGASVRLLRAIMGASAAPHDERWRIRYDDLPRAVRSAREKLTPVGEPSKPTGALLLTLAQFVAGFTPPAYLVDGILQRGYLYSLTARTNHGKTTIAMFVAMCIDRAAQMHGREVMTGTVLFLAGENSDDIRARFLVAADYYGFNPNTSKIRVIDGVINLEKQMPTIQAEAASIADLVLVVVDTAAAYFPGDETNSNSQQAAYARQLRQLTLLRGKPTVIVNCHPIKNAARDNLLPAGGGAFLNEVDGNLTLWADDKQVTLHWQGKFRGPEFEPLPFDLVKAESPRVVDAKGRPMPSVVAVPIADTAIEAGERKREDEENKVLWVLADNPKASFTRIAQKCDFVIDGREQRAKVQRIIARLFADKLVIRHRGGKYKLSALGRKELGLKDDNGD
jgi:AAA domain-containing protein/bifunctional DNA primase/polymerase-like protein